jgi:hypothetical protein
MDLCVKGLSKTVGPLILPPRATGVCPVQNTQTYTGGKFPPVRPQHIMCSHL